MGLEDIVQSGPDSVVGSPNLGFFTVGTADLPSSPPSPTALPIPPPVSQSPIPLPEQENISPACCANPPMTEGPLVPIEVESNDAEGSGEEEESILEQMDEGAVSQLWRNNQSRAAG